MLTDKTLFPERGIMPPSTSDIPAGTKSSFANQSIFSNLKPHKSDGDGTGIRTKIFTKEL